MNKITMPDTWEVRTKSFFQEFIGQTEYQSIQPYSNGFCGVGILKKTEDHDEAKGINQIVFMWYLTFDSAPDSTNRVAVKVDEAKSILNNLNDVLQEVEKRKNK